MLHRKPVGGDLLLCIIDGKRQLKHASAANSSVHNSTLHIFDVERYVEWGCILNCFMLSSLPFSMLFGDLLSLHLVTFLMFFILVIIDFR